MFLVPAAKETAVVPPALEVNILSTVIELAAEVYVPKMSIQLVPLVMV
jgi:hypothetical protein